MSKVNVKLSPFLPNHHALKTYWRSGGLAPRPDRITPIITEEDAAWTTEPIWTPW